MAKIAFYLDTRRLRSADIRDVYAGNPGIGGTEYMFFLVAACLARAHDVSMYVTAAGRFPPGIRYVVVRDFRHAAVAMWSAAEDVLVLRENEVVPHEGLLNSLRPRVMVWAHNFSRPDTLRACARCPSVARYLCVSREQFAMLRGGDIARKADYVFNGIVTRAYPSDLPSPAGDDVVYMGSLVRSKGFHLLARYWDDIKRGVPAARLHVVGSGRLYDDNASLGPLGLASEGYERQFAAYVTRDGRLRPDIVFHGVLGADKWRLLREAKVAVANPTGVGETFCITAVEFGVLGVPVVTRRYGGPKDVVEDGVTGLLFDDPDELPGAVVGLLKDERRRREMSRNAMALTRARFDIDVSIREWQRVIDAVMGERPVAGGRTDVAAQVARAEHDRRSWRAAALRVGAAVTRAYVRHFPIDKGKPWLWARLLERGIRGRFDGSERILTTSVGFRLLARWPGLVESAIDSTGRWEPQLTACMWRILAQGDTFVDMGAKLGYHSLLASRAVGEIGRVYAFEPDPATFEQLQQNIQLNGARNIHAFNTAPGSGWAGDSRASLLPNVPDDALFGARLIRIDTLSVGTGALWALGNCLSSFSARTAWAVTILPSVDCDAPGDAGRLLEAFESHGYVAFEVPDRYDPKGMLARPRPLEPVRRTRPPAVCTTVLLAKPGVVGLQPPA